MYSIWRISVKGPGKKNPTNSQYSSIPSVPQDNKYRDGFFPPFRSFFIISFLSLYDCRWKQIIHNAEGSCLCYNSIIPNLPIPTLVSRHRTSNLPNHTNYNRHPPIAVRRTAHHLLDRRGHRQHRPVKHRFRKDGGPLAGEEVREE